MRPDRWLIATLTAAAIAAFSCAHSPTTPSCTVAVPSDQLNKSIGAGGGEISVPVTTTASCAWTAVPLDSFLSVATDKGVGDGVVLVAVAPNPGNDRVGTVTVGDAKVTVAQGGAAECSVSLNPSLITTGAQESTVTVAVTASSGCAWTAGSRSSFLEILSGSAGLGSGVVTIAVAANAGAARAGFARIGDQVVVVSQAAGAAAPPPPTGTPNPTPVPTPSPPASCSFTVEPASFSVTVSAAGGAVTFTVTASNATCTWTASSSSEVVTFSPTTVTGSGTTTAIVAANTGFARDMTITVAGKTKVIGQQPGANCAAAFGNTAWFDFNGGARTASLITSNPQCAWTVTGGGGFVTVNSAAVGSGSGDIAYTVASNLTGATRETTMSAGGKSFTIKQSAAPPADGTFFSYHGTLGDRSGPGFGQSYLFTLAGGGSWQQSAFSGPKRVDLTIAPPAPADAWQIIINSPETLVPGTYDPVTDHISATALWVDVVGGSAACSDLIGRLVILEAAFTSQGTINRFHATLDVRCGGQPLSLDLRLVGTPLR